MSSKHSQRSSKTKTSAGTYCEAAQAAGSRQQTVKTKQGAHHCAPAFDYLLSPTCNLALPAACCLLPAELRQTPAASAADRAYSAAHGVVVGRAARQSGDLELACAAS